MRKRALKTGANACATLKRAVVMLVCPSSSENTVKEAKKLSKKLNCSLYMPSETLESLTGKENVKVMAITDKELGTAVINSCEKERKVED